MYLKQHLAEFLRLRRLLLHEYEPDMDLLNNLTRELRKQYINDINNSNITNRKHS